MTNPIKKNGVAHDGSSLAFTTFGAESDARRMEEILGGKDRIAVIVGQARLEELLRGVLDTFLCGTEAEKRAVLSRPFNANVELAYVLGLISKEVKSSLVAMAQLRNEFAHSSDYHTFEDMAKQTKTRNKLKALFDRAIDLGAIVREPFDKNEAKSTKRVFLALFGCLEAELRAATRFAKTVQRSKLKSTHSVCTIQI